MLEEQTFKLLLLHPESQIMENKRNLLISWTLEFISLELNNPIHHDIISFYLMVITPMDSSQR